MFTQLNLEFFRWIRYWYPRKTKDGFPIRVETAEISPVMINLFIRSHLSCLMFQNQIANDEDKTVSNPMLCWRL